MPDPTPAEIVTWLHRMGDMVCRVGGDDKNYRTTADLIERLVAQRDNPEWDGTDAASPAWWRGQEHGADSAARRLEEVLDGTDAGQGVSASPIIERVRRRLLALLAGRQAAEQAAYQRGRASMRAECELKVRIKASGHQRLISEEPDAGHIEIALVLHGLATAIAELMLGEMPKPEPKGDERGAADKFATKTLDCGCTVNKGQRCPMHDGP